MDALKATVQRKLMLISAPAGFGKSTLVSAWVAAHTAEAPLRVAWLSLDDGDSDPIRFLTYLVTALQTLPPPNPAEVQGSGIGNGVLALLQSPQPPSVEVILTALLNELVTLPGDAHHSPAKPAEVVLVLDDYHLVDNQAVDQALTFLLDHLPNGIHLIITTREDPNLPLARYRVRGELGELRAADLRFTASESRTFLNEMMGLSLSVKEISTLESRTEGWIAGLQLAALSMQGRAENGEQGTAQFIQGFTGNHHFVLDYLVEEVLHRQPAEIRTFLLQTAMLDRLCGGLCDAVTGRHDGKAMLETLERSNLFVIRLDEKRQWYRYHHLFADVLNARAFDDPAAAADGRSRPTLATLHQRASEWYEHHDLLPNAIHHALAAADFERAADLVERAWPAMHRSSFRSAQSLRWMQAIPDEMVRVRPVLSVGYAWEELNIGAMEAAEARLQEAERWLQPSDAPIDRAEMVVVDEDEFSALPASIASARAYLSLALGDIPGTVRHARRALELFPATDYVGRGPAASLLGLAYWATGALENAYRTLDDAMTNFRLAGNILFALSGTYGLADIRIAQGRLHEAIEIYQQALQLATAQAGSIVQGTGDLYLGLSGIYWEQGDREAAQTYLQKSQALGEQAALPDWPYRCCLLQARFKEGQNDLTGALDLLDQAEAFYVRSPVPNVRPIAALKARIWIAQGKMAEARQWARDQGLSLTDEPTYLREFEYITLARLLMAAHRDARDAQSMATLLTLLERLLQAAEAGGRKGSMLEILLLQALVHDAQQNLPAALAALTSALSLAEPEKYVSIFVDEGPPMARLLAQAAAQGNEYAAMVLAAFEGEKPQPRPAEPALQPLVDPLSPRELEVLQLIAQGLSNQAISERLFLAVNTVKGHNRRIFEKLAVKRRTEAVAQARALGLIELH